MTKRVGRFARSGDSNYQDTLLNDEEQQKLSAQEMRPATPKGLNKERTIVSQEIVNRVMHSADEIVKQSQINNQKKEKTKMSTNNRNAQTSKLSFHRIDTVANVNDVSSYTKLANIEGEPICVFHVELTKGSFNNKPNITAWMDTINLASNEPMRVVTSAYAVVLQLKECLNNGTLPVLGKFVQVKFNNNKRWEFVDIDLDNETDKSEEDIIELIENSKQFFIELREQRGVNFQEPTASSNDIPF